MDDRTGPQERWFCPPRPGVRAGATFDAVKLAIDRRAPVYRLTLEGPGPAGACATLATALAPLLTEDFPHLAIDARKAHTLSAPVIATLMAPVARILLEGGGVVLVAAPPDLLHAVERLGLEGRVPAVGTEAEALDSILRMIPKRFSNRFFQLMVEDGLATQPQIRDVHAEYKRHGGSIPFGTLLVKKGFVTIEKLLLLLDKSEHPERYPTLAPGAAAPPPDRSPASGAPTVIKLSGESEPPRRSSTAVMGGVKSEFFEKRLLGEILIESGMITDEQLRAVLEEQNRLGVDAKLGDMLIQKGLVNPNQLFEALEIQLSRKGGRAGGQRWSSKSEFVQRSLLGEILVEMKLIREQDLRVALDEQKTRPTSKLGNILVQMGVLGSAELLQALEYQANRRR